MDAKLIERLIWVVPLVVAALGAWRPRAGLLALAAGLPLFGSSTGGPYLGALEVSAIAAIVTAWRGGRPAASPLAPAAFALVAVSLLSLVPSPYAPPSWRPSLLLALARALPGVQDWSALFSWRMAADLVIGYGLFQAVRRAFAGRSIRPLALALLAGLVGTLLLGLASQAGLVDLLAYRPMVALRLPEDERLRSLFFASTRLAEYIVIAAPFGLAALAGSTPWARRLLLPLAGLILAGLVLTLQRGGWAAGAAQLGFLAIVVWRRRRPDRAAVRRVALAVAVTTVLTVAALALGGASLGALKNRALGVVSGATTRLPMWVAATEMIRERPLLGQGLGTFAPAYDRLQAAGLAEAIPYRASGHHLYLQLTAERGLLGLLAFGLLGLAAILCLRRPAAGLDGIALGLGASLLGVAVYGLVQNLFQLRINGWLIWIVLGCVARVGPPHESAVVRRGAWALVVAALLLLPFRLTSEWPAYAGSREFGFHEIEPSEAGDYRWTEGFAAKRLTRAGDTLILTLANGHPLGARRPVTVVAEVDGRVSGRWAIADGWQEQRIELEPSRADSVLLVLRVWPTFRPFSDYRRYPELPPSVDHRSLGVAMREPRWE